MPRPHHWPTHRARYLSSRYTERLADAGIEPSVGSRGDAYDNALAESVIGLFKAEVIRRKGRWRALEAVEFATLAWVDWFNHRRLLEPIGYVPPAEYEARYYEQAAVACLTQPALRRSRYGSHHRVSSMRGTPSAPPDSFMPSRRGCSVRASEAIVCPGTRPPTRAHNLDRDRRPNSGASETAWCQTSGNVDS